MSIKLLTRRSISSDDEICHVMQLFVREMTCEVNWVNLRFSRARSFVHEMEKFFHQVEEEGEVFKMKKMKSFNSFPFFS